MSVEFYDAYNTKTFLKAAADGSVQVRLITNGGDLSSCWTPSQVTQVAEEVAKAIFLRKGQPMPESRRVTADVEAAQPVQAGNPDMVAFLAAVECERIKAATCVGLEDNDHADFADLRSAARRFLIAQFDGGKSVEVKTDGGS